MKFREAAESVFSWTRVSLYVGLKEVMGGKEAEEELQVVKILSASSMILK